MNNSIVLNKDDVEHLNETIDYFLSDDKELDDFIERLEELGLNSSDFFNEHIVLILDKVPKSLHSHIYYRLSYLRGELMGVTYGG